MDIIFMAAIQEMYTIKVVIMSITQEEVLQISFLTSNILESYCSDLVLRKISKENMMNKKEILS